MKKWFKRIAFTSIGAFLGAVAGYTYYLKVGCTSGTCLITSNPINSTVYGAIMGALIGSMLKKERKEQAGKE